MSSIFISYSHKDQEWLDRVKTALKPIARGHNMELWDDSRIRAGVDWQSEIDKSLKASDVAILLVSLNFFASDFINDVELKSLLNKRAVGLKFFWIPITDSAYELTALQGIQAIWNPKKPLDTLPEAERNIALVQIARLINAAVSTDPPKGSSSVSTDPPKASWSTRLPDNPDAWWRTASDEKKIVELQRSKAFQRIESRFVTPGFPGQLSRATTQTEIEEILKRANDLLSRAFPDESVRLIPDIYTTQPDKEAVWATLVIEAYQLGTPSVLALLLAIFDRGPEDIRSLADFNLDLERIYFV